MVAVPLFRLFSLPVYHLPEVLKYKGTLSYGRDLKHRLGVRDFGMELIQFVRCLGNLVDELLVRHFPPRSDGVLQAIWLRLSIINGRRFGSFVPLKPVMYATPKPSGTTSPQPYTGKCLEKIADVLSTQ